jgi:hypothetical protein
MSDSEKSPTGANSGNGSSMLCVDTLLGVGVKMGSPTGVHGCSRVRKAVARDLHRQIVEASAQLKITVAAADHEQEAKLRSEISHLLDELDRISDLNTQRQIGGAL